MSQQDELQEELEVTPESDADQTEETTSPEEVQEESQTQEQPTETLQTKKEENRKGYQARRKPKLDIDSKLESFKDELRDEVRAELRAEREHEMITQSTSSPDEEAKIREILDTRIKRTDNLQNDIALAKVIANQSQYEAVEREKGAMAQAQNTGGRTSGASSITQTGTETQFSAEEQSLFARYGLDPKTGKSLTK